MTNTTRRRPVKRGFSNNPRINTLAKRVIVCLRTRHLLSICTTQSLINHFQLWGD